VNNLNFFSGSFLEVSQKASAYAKSGTFPCHNNICSHVSIHLAIFIFMVSYGLIKGVNQQYNLLLSGHRDQRISARYAHLPPENRDVMNFIEGKGTTTILLQSQKVRTLPSIPFPMAD